MKSVITTGVAMAAIIVGAMASATSALAAQNFHGNICQPQEGSQVNRFRYSVGIEALSSGNVACPLDTDGSNIRSIEVNVRFTSIPQATICNINAVDWNGNEKASITFSITPGSQFKIATIPDIAKGSFVAYSVLCGLPKGQVLTSINVNK